jgi:hypothetical protein
MNKVLIAIPGFIFLSSSMYTLQNIAKIFIDNLDKSIFIDNWMPWIAVLFFALGWFITHWIEIVLSKNQIRTAKLLFGVILIGGTLISVYFGFFIDNEVLHRFGLTSQFLVASGYFLRYSVFRDESLLLVRNAIFR